DRPRVRHGQGHPVRSLQRRQPLVQAPPEEGRAARHAVPRHAPHLRDAHARERRGRPDRPGHPRPPRRRHD
ncbi:MAG: hypothetical protein AVDCRST_MAG03-2746, partial [uncultured Rubrobacteraceae bacterium]